MSLLAAKPQFVVGTDLDRTLIENDAAPPTGSVPILTELLRNASLPVWFVTGETIDEVRKNIEKHDLPAPDVVVSENGTTVHRRSSQGLEEDREHKNRIRQLSPGWDIGEFRRALEGDLFLSQHLTLQEEYRQNEFKLSYYVPRNLLDEIGERSERIVTAICREAYIIRCIHNDDPQRAYLDVMSKHGDKAGGLALAADVAGIDPDQIAVAGDAGNDLRVLANQRFRGTVVKNARDEFKSQVLSRATRLGIADRVHFATGIPELGMSGNYSEGTMEGLLQHGLISKPQLADAISAVRRSVRKRA